MSDAIPSHTTNNLAADQTSQSNQAPNLLDVVVVGAGLSGIACTLKLQQYGLSVACVDSSPTAGGNAQTEKRGDFACERGPECFYIPEDDPAFQWLVESLPGLEPVIANSEARNRFVIKSGKPIKLGPGILFSSKLLSLGARFRLLCEPFSRSAPDHDESLADFARRRIGAECYETLIKPMCAGIFAGDPEKLSLQSAFPRFKELDRAGGLMLGGLKSALKKRWSSVKQPGPRKMINFRGGLSSLGFAAQRALGDSLRLGSTIVGLNKTESGYQIELKAEDEQHSKIHAKRVILATPAFATAKIVRDFDANLASQLTQLDYCSITVVALVYKKSQIQRPLSGFGALVGPDHRAESERLKSLGYLISSTVFEGRAPEDHCLIRTMIGGSKYPEAIEWSDSKFLDVARRELGEVIGASGPEVDSFIFRYPRGIPQYHVGHSQWLSRLDEALKSLPGLYLSGSSYLGPGLADVLRNSVRVGEKVAADTNSSWRKSTSSENPQRTAEISIST